MIKKSVEESRYENVYAELDLNSHHKVNKDLLYKHEKCDTSVGKKETFDKISVEEESKVYIKYTLRKSIS